MNKTGILYICGTPIGNLEDVSIRLLKTLRQVDIIVCEDTRQSIKLLNRYRIRKKLIAFHEHSDKKRLNELISRLKAGQNLALISDSGMPTISDPGSELIKAALEQEISLDVIPGPSAFTAALALSALDNRRFAFEGFLPAKKKQRRERLEKLKNEDKTLIFYESPHRLLACLSDLEEIFGEEREAMLARELTKLFAETKHKNLSELKKYYEENPIKGEITLLVAAASPSAPLADLTDIIKELEQLVEQGLDKKQALKMKAQEYGVKKSDLYQSLHRQKTKS